MQLINKKLLIYLIVILLSACHPSDRKLPKIIDKKHFKDADLVQTKAKLICEKYRVTENFNSLKSSRIDDLVSFGIERKAAKVIEHLLATRYANDGYLNSTDCMYLLINNIDLDPILVRLRSDKTSLT